MTSPGEIRQPDASISSADAESLRKSFRGEVLLPDDAGYESARAVWNAMIDRRPAIIARCKGAADVMDAVRFARARNLPVSIRGGGHNVAGHAVCDGGMMIDLSQMRAVTIDPIARRAWVEGGATWGDLDRESQAYGLATTGGLISDTGVAGLTLSGGIGWLRSKHGLSIDNLASAFVVTADGSTVYASAEHESDLLWALKGGGGNFGVVTMFEFALHPVGPEIMFCAPIYPIEAGAAPIQFWRDYLRDKNDLIGSLIEFSTIPSDPAFPEWAWGRRVYTIGAMYAGDAAEGEGVLRPLRHLGETVVDFSGRMTYCEAQKLFDTVVPFHKHRCYWKCHYLSVLDDDVIDQIIAGNRNPPSPNTLTSIWNFGGATSQVAADATAFGDRSMPYMFSIDSIWSDPKDDERNIAWTRDFWQGMARHSHGGRIYLNFPGLGEEGEALLSRSFGSNFARLKAIKAKHDPTNMFRFNQNILPTSAVR
jgi:FAD/FMN-containing dehydrogenase